MENMQKTNVTYLLRRIIYAALIIAIGYGVSWVLSFFNYPQMTIFLVIVAVAVFGIILNIINHFTTRFYEDGEALIIQKGFRGKKYAIVYAIITRCVINTGAVDNLFKTKQITIVYPDYKGISTRESLGLSAEYADKLIEHIKKKMKGEDSIFPE